MWQFFLKSVTDVNWRKTLEPKYVDWCIRSEFYHMFYADAKLSTLISATCDDPTIVGLSVEDFENNLWTPYLSHRRVSLASGLTCEGARKRVVAVFLPRTMLVRLRLFREWPVPGFQKCNVLFCVINWVITRIIFWNTTSYHFTK